MDNKCRAKGFSTNYQILDSGTVFKLLEELEMRQHWNKNLTRSDVDKLKSVIIREKRNISKEFI